MIFQNGTDIEKLGVVCPPKDFLPKELLAFRWTFGEIDHPENFKSQYHKKPNRFKKSTATKRCIAMSLSMFDTAENASSRFNALKKSMGDFSAHKILGTHTAKGKLLKETGVHNKADKRGHLSFFPSDKADLPKIFTIIEKLG